MSRQTSNLRGGRQRARYLAILAACSVGACALDGVDDGVDEATEEGGTPAGVDAVEIADPAAARLDEVIIDDRERGDVRRDEPEGTFIVASAPAAQSLDIAICGDGLHSPGELCYDAFATTFDSFDDLGNCPIGSSYSIDVGALNNGRWPDLVQGCVNTMYGQKNLILHRGNGSGGFSQMTLRSGSGYDVKIASFDGDTAGDVASLIPANDVSQVRVYIDAEISPASWVWDIGSGLHDLEIGDIDGDGHDDLIGLREDRVTLRTRNDTNNGFDGAYTRTFGKDANEVHVTDCDNDGRDDVIVATEDDLRVYRGLSNGALSHTVTYADGGGHQIASGDLDGDGLVDLVYSDGTTRKRRLNFGACTFGPYGAASFPGHIFLKDFNNDGNVDIAAFLTDEIKVYPGLGDGNMGSPKTITFSQGGVLIYSRAVGDFNDDDAPDFVFASNGGGKLLLSNP